MQPGALPDNAANHGNSDSQLCAPLQVQRPTMTTLVKVNGSLAAIVNAECTVTQIPVEVQDDDANTATLNVANRGLRDIKDYPTARKLNLAHNSISRYDFSNDRIVFRVNLGYNNISAMENFDFPSQLYELNVSGNHIAQFAPEMTRIRLSSLDLSDNGLQSLKDFRFPSCLKILHLSSNQLDDLDSVVLPTSIEQLFLQSNAFTTFQNFILPNWTRDLWLSGNKIKVVRGICFSQNLANLDLTNNPVEEFEIRETDVEILKKLSSYAANKHTTAKCSDPTAKKEIIHDKEFCVISDAKFYEKYNSKIVTQRSDDPNKVDLGATTSSSKSASSNSLLIVGIVGALVVVLLVVAFVMRRRWTAKHKSNRDGSTNATISGKKPCTTTMTSTDTSSDWYGPMIRCPEELNQIMLDDLSTDKDILRYRIDAEQLKRLGQIGRGSRSVMFRADYHGQAVAVRQILPSKVTDRRAISRFIDEIRLNMRLNHPNVIEFLGICWTSISDLAFVVEYMPSGDLYSLLKQKKGCAPCDFDWFDSDVDVAPWKSRVALDIAEALVYLHSFHGPIVHRNLKSRSVMFDESWVAKVGGFGESREKSVGVWDETLDMTNEVGTVAWTAPEVLQGLRYNEKSDIYSFGVILSELDTCLHPYGELELTQAGSSKAITSTRVALMVCGDELRPGFTATCPDGIKQLALDCLNHTVSKRPSAVEIHYRLRKLGAYRPPHGLLSEIVEAGQESFRLKKRSS